MPGLSLFLIAALSGLWTLSPPKQITTFKPKRIDRHFKWGMTHYTYKGVVDRGFRASLSSRKKIPPGATWKINGFLEKKPYGWILQLKEPPQVIEGFSLTEMRYQLREHFFLFLQKYMPLQTADIAAAFFMGRKPMPMNQNAFQKVGLSHLICLSGFHFAALAALLAIAWPKERAKKAKALFIIAVLSLFTFCVGDAPSVWRAYIAALLYFSAPLVERESNGLHALGLAALFELILSPTTITHAGFRLSYAATAGLILFYAPIQNFLIRPRNPENLGLFDLHALVTNNLFLKGLSLQLAVTATILPLTLYYFHIYPVGSLVYNLIYPPLIALAMLLVLLSLPFAPLCGPLYKGIDILFTSLYYLPRLLQTELYFPISGPICAFWLFSLLISAFIRLTKKEPIGMIV